MGYSNDNGLFYLLGDHLGSTSVLVHQNGALNSRQFYYPYGAKRSSAFSPLTSKRFTGQYHEETLAGSEGLYDYGARWYDAQLGRFLSADSIVPDTTNPQAFNRYSYVYNNPVKFVDPSGHAGLPYQFDGGGAPPPPADPQAAAEAAARAQAVMTNIANTIAYNYEARGTAWDDLPSGVRNRLTRANWSQGEYEDIGAGVTSMEGTLADPAVIASSLFAIGRAYTLIARLAPYLAPVGSFIAQQTADVASRLRQWWAGGTRPYLVSRGMVFGYRSPVRATDLTLGKGVTAHIADIVTKPTSRYYGERARPFLDSRLLMQEIMDAAPPIRDPRGMPNTFRWEVPGYFHGRNGIWELVVNIRNREVIHFNFTSPRR